MGNMIIPLCRMARIRAANFTSCARAPLQDNETIHKLSTVSPPLSLPSTVPPPFAISLLLCFLPFPFSRDKPKEIHPVSFISSSSSSSSRQCQLLSRCRNSINWKITFPRAPCSICSVVKTSKENASRPPLFSSTSRRCLFTIAVWKTGTTSFHLLFSCFFLSFFQF